MSTVELSGRGQLTIPKDIREAFVVDSFDCDIQDGKIVLTPLWTKDQLIDEFKKLSKHKVKNLEKRYSKKDIQDIVSALPFLDLDKKEKESIEKGLRDLKEGESQEMTVEEIMSTLN